MGDFTEIILNADQFDQILDMLSVQNDLLSSQIAYLDQLYKIGIIIPSIMLGVFILIMFYSLFRKFGG